MTSDALYNEIEPYAADWLDNLVAAGHIAPGRVERRSISDLTPADVAGPGQRHFFAGIGGWSYALRLAGVADNADVWTGSCPCQPFSDAGKRGGTRDARHLWPAWFDLIRQCRPPTIFGEQVASRDGLAWFDLVRADLEGCGYAVGASDLCAAGVGAPHIRQRLYFVAYASEGGRSVSRSPWIHDDRASGHDANGCGSDGLADSVSTRRTEGRTGTGIGPTTRSGRVSRLGDAGLNGTRQYARELSSDEAQHEVRGENGHHASVDSGAAGRPGELEYASGPRHRYAEDAGADHCDEGTWTGKRPCPRSEQFERTGDSGGFWDDVEWIPCIDGVSRPAQSGTFPLAHGVPARVGRLRGYGNAIVPQVAAAFIEAALHAIDHGDTR